MNIQSEIDFFSEMGIIDKARFLLRVVCEVADEAKASAGDGNDAARYRFATELCQRLSRFSGQLLSEDASRPADEVVVRMLLATRADKTGERMVQNAYRRVLASFESFDTTVLLNSH